MDYYEEYQRKLDDELLLIEARDDQLVPEAYAALHAELNRRGLSNGACPSPDAVSTEGIRARLDVGTGVGSYRPVVKDHSVCSDRCRQFCDINSR